MQVHQKRFVIKRDPVKGRIVEAGASFKIGELICQSVPVSIALTRTKTSFQIAEDVSVELNEPACLFCHSCDWDMFVRTNADEGYDFFASRDIVPGEELTWHYGMTEAYSIAVSDCGCGAPECMGRSYGFKEATLELQKKLMASGVADYLAVWYAVHSQ